MFEILPCDPMHVLFYVTTLSASQEHAGKAAIQLLPRVPRAIQQVLGKLQQNPVLRVHQNRFPLGNAEVFGIETTDIVQVTAGNRVCFIVASARIGVIGTPKKRALERWL